MFDETPVHQIAWVFITQKIQKAMHS